MRNMFKAVTENSAKVMNLEGYGIDKGCNADMVVLQAKDPIEAIRIRPARLFVVRRGRIISRTEPVVAKLDLDGDVHEVSFRR